MESEIKHGEAQECLEEIPPETIRLTVTSPPYNISKDYGDEVDDSMDLDEWKEMMSGVIEQLYRVTVPNGKVVVNLGQTYTNEDRFQFHPIMAWTKVMLYEQGFDYWGEVVWDKKSYNSRGGGALMGSYPDPSNLMIAEQHELAVVFRKYSEAQEIPEPGSEARDKSQLTKDRWRQITQSLWQIPPEDQKNSVDHPATFPVEFARRFIQAFSFYGDVVLDPFAGTGTTAVASKECGRKHLGFDLNEEYVEYAKERVQSIDWYEYPERRKDEEDALEW